MGAHISNGGIILEESGNRLKIQEKCDFCGKLGNVKYMTNPGKGVSSRDSFVCGNCKKE